MEGLPGSDTLDTYEIRVALLHMDASHRLPLGQYVSPKTAAESAAVEADSQTAADRPESLTDALKRRGVYRTHSADQAIPESDQPRFRLRRRRGLVSRLSRLVTPVLIATAAFLAGLYYARFL